MHKVSNIGSVVQAYALQHKIKQLGLDSEIIDYDYPYPKEKNISLYTILNNIVIFFQNFVWGFPNKKRERRMTLFREKYLICSNVSYDRESIKKKPPEYDIYCTGSDQVWNPYYIGDDTNFMLSFVPEDKPKISYAASFATNDMPDYLVELYSNCLKEYDSITVREQAGVDLVNRMVGKDAKVVCDPTLLLSREEWDEFAELSELHLKEDYILVYILGYMYNPRPNIYNIISVVQKALGCKVYYINGNKSEFFMPHSKIIKGVGPMEFVDLFKHASFVITDSFHGTAFSTIYNIPMMSVVNTDSKDGRMSTLRNSVGGSKSIVPYNGSIVVSKENLSDFQADPQKVANLSDSSILTLKEMLENVKQ